MYPILFEWKWVVLPAWHSLYALGALAAYFLLQHLRARHYPDIESQSIKWLFVICYFGGYFGARFMSIIIEQPEARAPAALVTEMFRLGPMTFYGGFLGALFGGSIYAFKRKLALAKLVDIAIPAGLLALSIGRIGCFLNGDDYGLVIPLTPGEPIPWWAVSFPNHPNPLPRYPVQLYESFYVLGLVGLNLRYFRGLIERFSSGFVGVFCTLNYAIFRFFIEFLRGDFRGWVIPDRLSTSQFISIAVSIGCVIVLAQRTRR